MQQGFYLSNYRFVTFLLTEEYVKKGAVQANEDSYLCVAHVVHISHQQAGCLFGYDKRTGCLD